MTRRLASRTVPLALVAVSAGFFLAMAGLRGSFARVAGDEGTYLAMAESLALDGDLAFDDADLERLEAVGRPGREAVILQRIGETYFYSKPAAFPLLAAPFYRLAGRHGVYLLNALALGLGLALAGLYLARFGGERALWLIATFAGAGSLLAYVAWAMSDAVLVGLTLGGLALALGAVERGRRGGGDTTAGGGPAVAALLTHPAAPLAGGALLGLVAAMRLPNAVVAVAAVAALALAGERRRALGALAGAALALLAAIALNLALTGAASPYATTRATFDPRSGFPVDPERPDSVERFETALATFRPLAVRPRVTAYAGLYFVAGRHTGLAIYFPLALALAAAAAVRRDRVGLALLAGAVALAVVFLVRLPHNYFGGGACVGNRYFLPGCAALLFAPAAAPRRRTLIGVWLLAAAVALSALVSTARTRHLDPASQNHAYAGLFRWLPYESTATSIEGTRERFWLHAWGDWEILRFTDPYSRVGAWSFGLDSGRPPAEVEIGRRRTDPLLRFLVLSEAPELTFVYRDWLSEQRFALERPMGERGVVEVRASPAWRRHPFWFWWLVDEIFQAHVARLSIETPDGSPASAQVRYLSAAELPRDIFARTVVALEAPAAAIAGERSRVRVAVRNDSSRTWTSEDVIAVHLGHRLTGANGQVIEGARKPIVPARPGEVLDASLEVAWPEVPGTYRLTVDLLVEGYAWFEQAVGEPLGAVTVEVASEGSSPGETLESAATGP